MRILGLPIWRERLSDDAFVERLRISLARPRRRRAGGGALLLVVALGVLWGLGVFIRSLATAPQQSGLAIAVFIGAILLGLLLGSLIASGFHVFMTAVAESRKDQLLVDCWDALHGRSNTSGRAV